MTSTENPLVARVMVNRIWQWYFGEGLVASENDFGVAGERPRIPSCSTTWQRNSSTQAWSVNTCTA